jgi:hypothetical protein
MSAIIQLTDADVDDLRNGCTINVEDEHGTEIILGPNGSPVSAGDLEALESGAELFMDDGRRLSYPD